jgi:hypothetical protein
VLSKILSAGFGDIIESVGSVVDKFHTSDEERVQMKLAIEKAITERMAVIESSIQERFKMVKGVIEAEMASGDAYTKRARPTLVYFGMVVIALNYLLFPWMAFAFGSAPPTIELPEEFWYAWTGVVGLWIVGRSAEKSAVANKATNIITGSKSSGLEL